MFRSPASTPSALDGSWRRRAAPDRATLLRRVVVVASLTIVAFEVLAFAIGWIAWHDRIPLGLDWLGYRAGFERLLATGSPYAAFELAGPFVPEHLDFIHPPNALVLFAPFALLPQPLDFIAWDAIPLAVLAYPLRRLAWWAWPFVAALTMTDSLQYPILNGNSSLWMCAAFSLGLRFGWPAGLIAMKPSLAPLALVAIHRPRPAIALAILPIVATLPLLPDYLVVLRNANLGLSYSITQYSLVAFAAWPWVAERLPGWLERLRPIGPRIRQRVA
jgi:hypothetical protein